MKYGEAFELEAEKYLNETFGKNGVSFHQSNTADSTKSDILVKKSGKPLFYIEAKDSKAQGGQFAVLNDAEDNRLLFSQRNKTEENSFTEQVMDILNKEYEKYAQAGTSGEEVPVSEEACADWIVEQYKKKGAKYFFGKNTGYFICPVEKVSAYFRIRPRIRAKGSGSQPVPKKEYDSVANALLSLGVDRIWVGKTGSRTKLFASSSQLSHKQMFSLEGNRYMLSAVGDIGVIGAKTGIFEVRRLSNTKNLTFICTLEAKKEQDPEDRKRFQDEIARA